MPGTGLEEVRSPLPGPRIIERPLPYERRLAGRDPASVELAVVHCTELPDLATARRYGETVRYPASRTGNSGHFYIDRDGRVEQWVTPDRVAHHVRGHNSRSIGIELVNLGRYPDWLHVGRQTPEDPYPAEQIDALVRLLQHLADRLPSLRWIAGHEDLDTTDVPSSNDPAVTVRRKRDPGPLFPWPTVLAAVPLTRRCR